MTITRIKPPKYKVGRYSLNEYELRCLMAETCEGKHKPGIQVKDKNGVLSEITKEGRLTKNLFGLDINTMFTMTVIKHNRQPKG